jgi:hypothetical protein
VRYRSIWLEIAREQYNALAEPEQEQVRARVEQLIERPELPPSAYDPASDQWITTYGGGAGLIVCAIVQDRQAVIILRLA